MGGKCRCNKCSREVPQNDTGWTGFRYQDVPFAAQQQEPLAPWQVAQHQNFLRNQRDLEIFLNAINANHPPR